MNSKEVDEVEVRRWVELLRSEAQEDKLKAASQLGRIGVRTRGPVVTRGSLSASAKARMAKEQLNVALRALSDKHTEVRKEVAFAIGEWADEIAVTVLSELAQRDEDVRVRIAATDALAKIGGPAVVKMLQVIARKDPHEDARASAISGLGNLALASVPTRSETLPARTRGAVRTRGAARTRSTQAVRRSSP
jgi:HEAT repeat protein